MNNKLEFIRNSFAMHASSIPEEGPDEINGDISRGFTQGFDAAIALDLPVKFAEWKDSDEQYGEKVLLHFGYSVTDNKNYSTIGSITSTQTNNYEQTIFY